MMQHVKQKQIADLLNGHLTPEQEMLLMAHIAECDECAALLYDAAAAMPLVTAPADSPNQMLLELRRKLQGSGDSLWRYSLRVAVSVCAALVLLFSNGFGALTELDYATAVANSSQFANEITDSLHSIQENILIWRDSEHE